MGLALASCRSDRPATDAAETPDAQPASAATAANTVTIVTTDFAFQSPAELPAGLTTFRLVNQGPSLHHVQLIRLEEGKTMDDFAAALKAGGPPPRWMVMAGGPNPPEMGDTASTTLTLQPGTYAMVCFVPTPDGVPHLAKGMVRPLTVTPAAGSAPEPSADLVMKLVDYDFELSAPLTAGRHTIRIENAGPQEHEVAIVKLDAGKEPMEFAEWGERGQVGPAPGTMHGGVSAIAPGSHAFVDVDLEPGEYGLICFVPDVKDGKGHYHHGMVKRVKVGDATA